MHHNNNNNENPFVKRLLRIVLLVFRVTYTTCIYLLNIIKVSDSISYIYTCSAYSRLSTIQNSGDGAKISMHLNYLHRFQPKKFKLYRECVPPSRTQLLILDLLRGPKFIESQRFFQKTKCLVRFIEIFEIQSIETSIVYIVYGGEREILKFILITTDFYISKLITVSVIYFI